jgi:FkbH-like protein
MDPRNSSLRRTELLRQLRSVIADEDEIIVLHSSLALLGGEAGPSRWDLLHALRVLVDERRTIALPAFTFSFCGTGAFSSPRTPSETGVLAEWVLAEFPDASRTPHPIYSFVVCGPAAGRIAACPSTTTFGDDSPFALFEVEDARIVMLGCDFRYCTQLHRSEEKARVPYRYYKDFRGKADFGDGIGEREVAARMLVRDLALDPKNDFGPAIDRLRNQGAIRTGPVLGGVAQSVTTAALSHTCDAMLAEDAWVFVVDGKAQASRSKALGNRTHQPPLRVALLGHANLALIEKALTEQLAAAVPDRRIEVYAPPFGRVAQEILDAGSRLTGFHPDLTVCVDRLEDLFGAFDVDGVAPGGVEDRVREHAALLRRFHEQAGTPLVLCTFAPLTRSARGLAGDAEEGGAAPTYARANRVLRDALDGLGSIHFLDVSREASLLPAAAFDSRLWFLGRFPFSEAMSRHLASRVAALVVAAKGRSIRLIAVDLDNTLWGGVVGEDGVAGIKVGGDFPGNAYAAFQAALKRLSARGIALAVTSKNDEAIALEAIDGLPAMVLRKSDFVASRINWNPKWQNIQEVCADLALGLESVLFIDDNPVEREQVRRNLPGVKVLELPDDPARYVDALLACPWIETLSFTAEDFRRVESYKARDRIQRERQSAANLDEFFASLGMKLHLAPMSAQNAARAAQLVSKTNQFNATTRRYTQRELEERQAAGWDIVVIGLEDKHTAFENIGVLALQPATGEPGWLRIDSYLLSCRVLGRGLENALVRWTVGLAKRRGYRGVIGEIVVTERNEPVRRVYAEAGFRADPEREGLYRCETADADTSPPPWVQVVDQVGTGAAAAHAPEAATCTS